MEREYYRFLLSVIWSWEGWERDENEGEGERKEERNEGKGHERQAAKLTSTSPSLSPSLPSLLPNHYSSVLTGSYHNYFRIYDVETTNDIVLQADKSAFKAKKVGGVKGGPKGGKPGSGGMDTTGTDFNKKIVSFPTTHPTLLLFRARWTELTDLFVRSFVRRFSVARKLASEGEHHRDCGDQQPLPL